MKWRENQVQIKLTLLLTIGIIGIFTICFFANNAFKSLRITLKEFQYPDQKIKHLSSLSDQINNVDQFLRLYSITKKDVYLQKYNNAIDSVNTLFKTYKKYIATDSFKMKQIDTIQSGWQNKLTENKELLKLNNGRPDILVIGKIIDKSSKDTTLFSTQINNEKTTRDSLVIIKKIPVTNDQKTGFLHKVKRVFNKKEDDEVVIDTTDDDMNVQLFSYTYKKRDTTYTDTLIKIDPFNKTAKASVKNFLKEKLEFDTIVNLKRLAIIEKDFMIRNKISKQIKIIQKQEQADAQANIITIQNISSDAINRILLVFIFILFSCICLYILLVLDSYKIKKYQEQLIREKQNYLNLATNRSQFLSMMAHELRTPLQSIIGFSDLLHEQKRTTADKSFHYSEIIKKSSLHLLQTINLLLDRSKIDAGKLELENISFNLSECIQDVFESLSIQANEKKITYTLNSDIPDNLIVYSDSFRLKQILYNLLSNAIKFTSEGRVTLTCRSLKQSDKTIRVNFKISDTGIGIPKNKVKHLFEEYNQLDKSKERLFGGTGLGLVITKKILELFSSKLLIQSEEKIGTTFLFDLYFETREFISSNKVSVKQNDFKSILIIDDDNYNLLYIHQLLKKSFQDVCIASSITEALAHISKKQFEIILCDLYINDHMGSELLPHVPKTTKVIFMSADHEQLNQLKAQHFILPKPFTIDTLQDVLNTTSIVNPADLEFIQFHKGSLKEKTEHLQKAYADMNAASVLFYLHQIKTTLGYLKHWEEIKNIQKIESTFALTKSEDALFHALSDRIDSWKKLF